MQVRLFGGVAALTDDGESLDLGPARCRVVLAALALSVGEAVAVSRLVDVVWGDDPPRTAEKTLQGYVVRLRKGLGADTIIRTGTAYRLDLDPDTIDVARFRHRLRGRDIEGALAMWTGRPLAGLVAPGLTAVVDGLEEQWLDATEDDLGRQVATDAPQAIAALTELTATHPFREELWALLMIALYRAGRQADALAAFQRAREHLTGELGIEPGPRLRDVEAQILGHDEGLRGGVSTATAAQTSGRPTGTVTFGVAQDPASGGAVEVRLLGPVELVVDGEVRPVAGAGERILLAVLAGAGGRMVSRERLIDALWGAVLPANPTNALHLRVSRLRKQVGAALIAESGGYVLAVAPDDVDLLRFARLVAEGRDEEALALWRGPPLEEFLDQPWARAEAGRLEELRATAVEERLDRLLAAGEHVGLIAELEGLVAAAPLRERLRGQLMLALHRSGRSADALATYQEVRRFLDDELGLEPGPELRRLQQAILRQDPTLEVTVGGTTSVGNLPSPLTSFIGRHEEMTRLRQLSSSHRLLTLVGPGGAGKTSLALAFARQVAGDYPDGAWFVALSEVRTGAGITAAVADALNLTLLDADSALKQLIAWLAPRRALLILDNCEQVADAAAHTVQRLLEGSGGLRVLTTSREALAVPGEMQVAVPPLPVADAVILFTERAAAVGVDVPRGDVHVTQICAQLDRMPLAIELAAARSSTLSTAEIAARLGNRFRLLTGGPRTAAARHKTLRATVEWSHELLSATEQALFSQLSTFAGGWTLAAAEAVCRVDGEVLDLLDRLVRQSLVVTDGVRFRMLETIRYYAQTRLADRGDQGEDVQSRHAVFFTDLAEAAEPVLRGPTQRAQLADLRAEEANLEAALQWARQHVDTHPDLGLRLAAALGWYWYVGRQVDGRPQLRTMLDAAVTGSPGARARALQALSLALRPAGCIVHPHAGAADAARQSMALFTSCGEPARGAISSLLVAVEAVDGADIEAHLREVEDARTALRTAGDGWGLALADFIEMEVRLHHRSVADALSIGRRSIDLFDALEDDWGRSAVRLHLGVGLRLAGHTDEAAAVLSEAVALSRDTGLLSNLARACIELAEVALFCGDADRATHWLGECEQVVRDLGSDSLLALMALVRAGTARLVGHQADARRWFAEALQRADAEQVPRGIARALLGRAAVDIDDGSHGPALDALQRVTPITEQLGDAALSGADMEQRARIAAVEGDHAAADRLLSTATALRDRHDRPRAALDVRDVRSASLLQPPTA